MVTEMGIEMRRCRECNELKPESSYKSERGVYCADCRREVGRERQRRWREKKHIVTGRKQTLCWTCKNAYGHCSWTEVDNTKPGRPIRYEPVKGWDAIQTENEKYKSYCVLSCPEYEPGDRMEEETTMAVKMSADLDGMPRRLREARENKSLSLQELAEISGVSATAISNIECGRSNAMVRVMANLCDALGVSLQWMVYGT